MLRVAITSLYGPVGSGDNGDVLGQPSQFTDCQVEIPYANDARTARVTISVFDEAAAEVRPLDRMLKIWYRFEDLDGRTATRLVFWGPIINPEWNLAAGTVTINAHDPSLRLKHSYINYSDTGILDDGDTGGSQATGRVTTDGDGMQLLLDSGEEPTDDFPQLGIAMGYDTSTPAELMNNGEPRAMEVTRGDESFQKMVDLSVDPLAPDFEIEPWDGVGDYPGAQGDFDQDDGWDIEDAVWNGSEDVPSYLSIPIEVDLRHNCGKIRMSFYLRHTFVGDIWMALRHPDGTEVVISDNRGLTRDGWGIDADHRLYVDDAAPWKFDSSEAQMPYIVGSIAPMESFSTFRGKPALGTWHLIIKDTSSPDSGHLYAFALLFEGRGNRIPGQYARMNVWRKEDSGLTGFSSTRFDYKGNPDKRATIVFQYGFGVGNVEEMTYKPGGDRVLNYYVAVTESKDDTKDEHRGIKQDYSSRVRYGTYMGWKAEGSNTVFESTDPAEVLISLASMYVAAYGVPPDFVEFTPKPDAAVGAYLYVRDYWPGDTVTVQAKRGYLTFNGEAFITKVTLTQKDEAGNTQTKVEAVPLAPGSLSDPGDVP